MYNLSNTEYNINITSEICQLLPIMKTSNFHIVRNQYRINKKFSLKQIYEK